jgi:hypothetical protein
MGTILTGLFTILVIYISTRLWHLHRNYRAARATGLPVVVCPYDPDSVSRYLLLVIMRRVPNKEICTYSQSPVRVENC